MWLVMRAPFLPIGSLAICTRISWPSFSRSLIRGTGADSRRRKRRAPPPPPGCCRGVRADRAAPRPDAAHAACSPQLPPEREPPRGHRRCRCRGLPRRAWPRLRPAPLPVPALRCPPRLRRELLPRHALRQLRPAPIRSTMTGGSPKPTSRASPFKCSGPAARVSSSNSS